MSDITYPVKGKTVLITGAARGIGAESARRLAARGAKLSLVGLEPELLEQVASECGDDAVWFEADVTDKDELQAAIDGTVERFGGIDVVMANAGIGAGGTVRTMDPESWERVIEVNLFGVVRTIRQCLPHVIERKGYILPVASVAAAVHTPGMSAYAASKAAVEAFGNSLRGEVAHLGVKVGVAYFSWIDTEMVRGADDNPATKFMRAKLRGPAGEDLPGVGGRRGRGGGNREARAPAHRPAQLPGPSLPEDGGGTADRGERPPRRPRVRPHAGGGGRDARGRGLTAGRRRRPGGRRVAREAPARTRACLTRTAPRGKIGGRSREE